MAKAHSSGVTGGGGASGAKDMGALTRYMKSSYAIDVQQNVSKVDFEVTRKFGEGIDRMVREFPLLQGQLAEINGNMTGNRAYAGAGLNGTLH